MHYMAKEENKIITSLLTLIQCLLEKQFYAGLQQDVTQF